MKDSAAFEQQIHRIHEVLDGAGAVVTWDDHLPDPDNPCQLRQIDITIKRNEALTIVECRQHKGPQDVQWIEELIGRRTSLQAHGVIAVSSSGFTAGAIRKARSYGIVLRDVWKLSEAEIKDWGQQVTLTLYFYQYSDLEVSLRFDPESLDRLDTDVVRSELSAHPAMRSLFNAAAEQLGSMNLISEERTPSEVKFGLRMEFSDFQISGERVLQVEFRGKARLLAQEISAAAVFVYCDLALDTRHPNANVQTFSLGKTSVVHTSDSISVLLDVSRLEMPPFCQFRFFRLRAVSTVNCESIELLGIDRLWVDGKGLKVNLCSAR